MQSKSGGILLYDRKVSEHVKRGELLGRIVDPYTAETTEELRAPQDGVLFFARRVQIISAHTVVFRIIPAA